MYIHVHVKPSLKNITLMMWLCDRKMYLDGSHLHVHVNMSIIISSLPSPPQPPPPHHPPIPPSPSPSPLSQSTPTVALDNTASSISSNSDSGKDYRETEDGVQPWEGWSKVGLPLRQLPLAYLSLSKYRITCEYLCEKSYYFLVIVVT